MKLVTGDIQIGKIIVSVSTPHLSANPDSPSLSVLFCPEYPLSPSPVRNALQAIDFIGGGGNFAPLRGSLQFATNGNGDAHFLSEVRG
jgi:hypothetical protein